MRTTTQENYRVRIERVLTEMAARLDEPIGVADLASVAALSPFHFQRVFQAMTGETVAEVLRRLRLARAAWRLRQGTASVTELALDAGYGSVEGFARAFRRGTGLAPSAYRATPISPAMKQSNIRIDYRPERGVVRFIHLEGEHGMDVSIETLPWRRALCVRHVGSFDDIPNAYGRLADWAGSNGIDTTGKPCFGLSYSDPEADDVATLRYDACMEVEVPDGGSLPEGFRVETVGGGRYATFIHVGPYSGLSDAFQRLFGLWLPKSGEEPDARPCIEVYLNDLSQVPESDLRTRIGVPLKEV